MRGKWSIPCFEMLSAETIATILQIGQAFIGVKSKEQKANKIMFNIKLEKIDSATKIKVTKEVGKFTNLVFKEVMS
jgi:ribosomal protein L7/L12